MHIFPPVLDMEFSHWIALKQILQGIFGGWREAKQLRTLAALGKRIQLQFPGPMTGSSQPPLESIEYLLLSSMGTHTYVAYTHRNTNTYKNRDFFC